jgi:predicted ribosomally synthesized peptide with SipW-like signal peptide
MTERDITLTRRRILGSVAALGAAGAAGAGGTYAVLSDTEQSTDNSLSAGTLNLRTGGSESATTTLSASNNGTGSSGVASTTVNNVGSLDGVLNFDVGAITDLENGIVNDPESDAAAENGGSPGELSEYVTFRLGYDSNADGSFDDAETVVEGSLGGMENVQFNPNVPIPAGSDREFFVEWEIDGDAGNEIQSDSIEVDFTFELLERGGAADVVLSGSTPYGQGAGFAFPWDTTTSVAHTGSGAWGTVDHSSSNSSYKQGFYFAGDFSAISTLSGYTVSEIDTISYWLYEDSPLDGVDIYLNIYTRPEDDGDDAAWYDSRLQALPSEANRGSPNFTPGAWNEFTTDTGATNTLVWSDTGRGGNFNQDLPTLDNVQSGAVDWSNWGASLSQTHDYRDEEVMALSLQTGSGSGVDLEAYIDDITVELTTGETLTVDLEP